MRIKIISDGTAFGTKIVDAATGEAIDFVTAIEFKIRAADNAPSVVIEVLKPIIDVSAEAVVKVD